MANRDNSRQRVETDRYVSVKRLAEILDCSPRTIDKWRLLGKGPRPTRFPTGAIRYKLTDVEKWLHDVQTGESE